VAILLSFVLAVIATRATGETNNNPVGAVGHVTQGVFSGIGGGGAFPNVLAGGITAAGAQQAADMMQDLKTGHLLGATPRRQFIAQLVGVSVGALVAVPAFFLLWKAYGIGPESEMLPAPAGISWSNFARVLSEGFDALPPHSAAAVLVAALLGVALTLPSRRVQRWLPSPFALGIAFIYPGMYALTICLGSLLGRILQRFAPRFAEGRIFLLAAGLIVGEAVMGTLIAAWILTGDLVSLPLFLLLPVLLLALLAYLAYHSARQMRRASEEA
jgi:OPT family oligopeptide transporter